MSAHLALPASLSIYKLAFPHCALSSVAFVLSRDDGTDAGDGRGGDEGPRARIPFPPGWFLESVSRVEHFRAHLAGRGG